MNLIDKSVGWLLTLHPAYLYKGTVHAEQWLICKRISVRSLDAYFYAVDFQMLKDISVQRAPVK